jgi:hypothetical protein
VRVKASRLARGSTIHCNRECAILAKKAQTKATAAERFWERVDRNGPVARTGLTPCWLWLGHVLKESGYGAVHFSGKQHRVHRVAWLLTHGEWPEECALHQCDVRHCVNPGHLFGGDRAANNADRHQKERDIRGEEQWMARLTEDDVRTIRSRYAAGGVTQGELADEFSVSREVIGCAIRRRTWKHVA